ncbi:MAG: hypothetical protein Q4C96_09390 [Planctomycetia bacterium]|nr:hypothetical protein [Planctomycetia bacterium]
MTIYVEEGTDTVATRKLVAELTLLNHSAFTVVSIPQIPRNESGKILYSRLPE